MNLSALHQTIIDQPKYRLKQIKKAVFCDFITDWEQATTLPKDLRATLTKEVPLDIAASETKSKDGTVKALVTFADKLKVETVLIRHKDKRNTICVSSQVGCPLACAFCATGQSGFRRNLTAFEIVEQIIYFARILKQDSRKVTNVVFMGMGEPFLNYDNVIKAIRILNEKDGFNLGIRHMSISTIGITEGIRKLANEKMEVNLAISLHVPNDKKRMEIIPAGKKYGIRKIMEAVDYYIEKTNRRVMFEYLLIDKFNDSIEDAKQLAILMKKPLYFVNLIIYNATGRFTAPSKETVKRFADILQKSRVAVTERHSFGQDIEAACGQLAGKRNK